MPSDKKMGRRENWPENNENNAGAAKQKIQR
jgi:hypothetical protein